jgi:phosphatidylglycerophosphate synthase
MVNKLPDEMDCPIDVQLYKFISAHLHMYFNIGFTPNMITTLSILFGLLSAQQILQRHYGAAALCILISYYFDCVDGKLARKYNMVSKFGDMYDHVGDITKIIAIVVALFVSTKKISSKQWSYMSIFFLLTVLQWVHLGYQEAIYNKSEESYILKLCRKMVDFDDNPHQTIHCTKYFGCGTWYLCFAALIFIWRK